MEKFNLEERLEFLQKLAGLEEFWEELKIKREEISAYINILLDKSNKDSIKVVKLIFLEKRIKILKEILNHWIKMREEWFSAKEIREEVFTLIERNINPDDFKKF